ITDFAIAGQVAPFTIDADTHTIAVTVPEGTTLNIAPEVLVISESATIDPAIDAQRDFSGPVQYTVTAENGESQVWTVNTTVVPPTGSDANDITAFALPGQNSSDIDGTTHTIIVIVPDGTALADIAPSILSVSPGATVTPLLSETQDFNAAVVYTVRATNGDLQEWTVNTTVAANQPPVAVDNAIGMEIGQTITIDVLGNDTDPDTPAAELTITNVSAVSPAGFGNATIVGRRIEFVSNGPPGEPEIVTFDYTINDGNPGNDATATVTVNITLNEVLVTGIAVAPTSLILDIDEIGQLSPTVSPANATNRGVDWSSDNVAVATVSATGEVTAVSQGSALITASSNDASNVSQTVNVSVNPPASSDKSIESFGINDVFGTINGTDIALTLPPGTDVTALSPIIIFIGRSVDPASGAVSDFTNPVPYTVTADDDSTIDYTVTVTVGPNQPPVAVDDATGVELGGTVRIDVLANDTDPDTPNSELVIAGVIGVQPDNAGSFSQEGREFVFTPSGNHLGDATFGYTVNDGNAGNNDFGQVTVTISQTAVPVTGISLAPNPLALDVGQTGQLNATVSPGSSTDQTLSWSSSNEAVATVDTNGLVSGISEGPAVISASANDGSGVVGTANINVAPLNILVTVIVVSPSPRTITVGENLLMSTAIIPANATDQSVTWSSSDNSIASVDQSGQVTGNEIGSVTISAVANDASGTSGIGTVTVTAADIALTGISLTPPAVSIVESDTQQMGITFIPNNATNQDVTWSSSDETITTVDTNGLVTAIAEGAATIIATSVANNGIFGTASITVTPAFIPVTGISVSPPTAAIDVNATSQFTALILPADATDQRVNWLSGNTAIATVDSDGLVTGIAEGSTTIIAISAQNGTITANATIDVTLPNVPVTGLSVSPASTDLLEGTTLNLIATVSPANATNQNLNWITSNSAIATVDGNGVVTALQPGPVSITTISIANGSITASSAIMVTSSDILVGNIVVDPANFSLDIGGTQSLNLTITPANATNQVVNWSSSNPAIATVDNTGLVNAIAQGTATISATATDGSAVFGSAAVSVNDPRSAENDIVQFTLSPTSGDAVINTTNHTATIAVPFGTDLTVAPTNLVVSPSATVFPLGNVEQDFSTDVVYRVTAENGNPQDWTIIVNVAAGSSANDILQFTLSPSSGDATINTTNHTASITVPSGTDLTVAPTNLVVSPGATVSPLGNVEQDFSSTVNYTVTAQDGTTTQVWRVTVLVESPPPSYTFSIDPVPNEVSGPVNIRFRITPNQAAIDSGIQFQMSFAHGGGGLPPNFLEMDYEGTPYVITEVFSATYIVSSGLLEGPFVNCEPYSLEFTVTNNRGLPSQSRSINFVFQDGSPCP
ncbi:Ig-like domain-containing protein, partial [Maribacter sp.]|nr:Ig-like domain-containing protein [Maribacter sp.]